jgi:acyl carrier protein
MTITRQALLDYLQNQFGLNSHEISDSTLLFSDGLLDSLSVAELLMFIEELGGFAIEPTEITIDNFDSVKKILDFARQKTDSENPQPS